MPFNIYCVSGRLCNAARGQAGKGCPERSGSGGGVLPPGREEGSGATGDRREQTVFREPPFFPASPLASFLHIPTSSFRSEAVFPRFLANFLPECLTPPIPFRPAPLVPVPARLPALQLGKQRQHALSCPPRFSQTPPHQSPNLLQEQDLLPLASSAEVCLPVPGATITNLPASKCLGSV